MILPTRLIRTEWPNESLKQGNKRFDAIYESIKNIGIQEPVTINLKWQVINGNHRIAIARALNIDNVPVQVWTGTEMVL